jgi:ATP-dependent DNA ligase
MARLPGREHDGRVQLPVMPPVAPMLAKAVAEIPPGCYYEPKWDGFRSIVFRDGDEVEIGSRNDRPLTRYFPEVVAAVKAHLPQRCVVDGEIVVASPDGRSLDFNALQLRLHPAASRVALLAERTPAHFIAFDLLALGDADYTGRPFHERRTALEAALRAAGPPVHLTPITCDPALAARWFQLFEGAGLDGLIAKDGAEPYLPNKRVMAKVKHVRTADCVVAGYRVHKSGPDTVGSLLLGLYDDPADPVVPAALRQWASDRTGLTPVGVIGAFPMAMRRQLVTELQPLVTTFDGHPWNWAAAVSETGGGGYGSRWNPGKDLTFVPLRPERVVEVRYEHMEGHRFRHMAQFIRWRPDRDPRSCGFGQLDHPVRFDLAEILDGRVDLT